MGSEELLHAIGMIEDSMIEEAAPSIAITAGPIQKRRYLKHLLTAAACAAIALIAFLSLPPFHQAPTVHKPAQRNIVMNELRTFPSEVTGDIALFWDNYVPMTLNELNQYYGTDISPSYLPETFSRQMVADATYGNLGIFKRADGTIYHDNNELKYQSFNKKQSIVISAAKGHLPRYDVMGFYRGELKASDIEGNTVLFAHYMDDEGEHYYAEFLYHNVGFNLWGNNISQDEFFETVSAYFVE